VINQSESVSVGAELHPGNNELKSAPLTINNDDLDVPTFLRNRR
jgi:hypothetical protein